MAARRAGDHRRRRDGGLARSLDSNDGVYFVPALTGLGSPHWDPVCPGTIVGLTRGNGRAHLARAALEAIAYQTVDAVRRWRPVGCQARGAEGRRRRPGERRADAVPGGRPASRSWSRRSRRRRRSERRSCRRGARAVDRGGCRRMWARPPATSCRCRPISVELSAFEWQMAIDVTKGTSWCRAGRG